MLLFPAIDILDGRAVRLVEGKRELATFYGDPLELAHKWADLGARYLHIVDLNAAFGEKDVNDAHLRRIAREVKTALQLGGGIRKLDDIKYALSELGFARVVIGSSLITNPGIIEEASAFADKLVAGLDARGGRLYIKGWTEGTDSTPLETALRLKASGITDIVFTDISLDGRLSGVNLAAVKALQQGSGMNIIASGGIKDANDISALLQNGIYGAIIGKALYEGNINLREALKLCHTKE